MHTVYNVPKYRVNMKEFSVLIFHVCFNCILNHTALCCVLCLKEITVNLMKKVLVMF